MSWYHIMITPKKGRIKANPPHHWLLRRAADGGIRTWMLTAGGQVVESLLITNRQELEAWINVAVEQGSDLEMNNLGKVGE